jgi:DNA-binding transcriptional regulator YhcF (GntR family)
MQALTIDTIFETAIRILIEQDQSLAVVFTRDAISFKFPTTRRLAEYLEMPHYYVLPYFAMMEEQALVTRAERVGIMTTPEGTRKLLEMIAANYREKAEEIVGREVFAELLRKAR